MILDDPDEQMEVTEVNEDSSTVSEEGKMFSSGVLQTVLLVGSFYFFVKFVRYALWSVHHFLGYSVWLDDTAG